jgi:hypothetical protein
MHVILPAPAVEFTSYVDPATAVESASVIDPTPIYMMMGTT